MTEATHLIGDDVYTYNDDDQDDDNDNKKRGTK